MTRQTPRLGPRLGPRPLPLHLAIQSLSTLSCLSALPLLRNGSLNLSPALQPAAKALAAELENLDPEAFTQAVIRGAGNRLNGFVDGVSRYRRATAKNTPAEPPVVWQRGAARLLDFGVATTEAMPILVVPSLINRAYILDLSEKRSLMRHLAGLGFRPYLLDWGWPGETERDFTLTDYITGTLAAGLDHIVDHHGRSAAMIGYCMGGNLVLPLAERHPDKINALALLATPWDFDAASQAQRPVLAAAAPGLEAIIESLGMLPVDFLQALFVGLNPSQTAAKFRGFADLDMKSAKAREFIALEDWVNDGVPLVGAVARECLFDWYLDNTPGRGQWRVDGQLVTPEDVIQPTLVVVPERDTIVPPASAMPLAEALPNARSITLPTGHIGMVAGSGAKRGLYHHLGQWLAEVSS